MRLQFLRHLHAVQRSDHRLRRLLVLLALQQRDRRMSAFKMHRAFTLRADIHMHADLRCDA
jgi:hypothetical protein